MHRIRKAGQQRLSAGFRKLIICCCLVHPVVASAQLDTLFLETGKLTIEDSRKIPAVLNYPTRQSVLVNARVELHGSTSQQYPKKSFGFTVCPEEYLPGMGAGKKWVLLAQYADRSLIRNMLAYHLGGEMGLEHPSASFVHLCINHQYAGLYLLAQRPGEESILVSNEEATRGTEPRHLVFKLDKRTGSTDTGWASAADSKVRFLYHYPSAKKTDRYQKAYLASLTDSFELALLYHRNWRDYADEASFINYLLLQELSKTVDAYRSSAYYSVWEDGKIHAGPIWDFDLCFGNTRQLRGNETNGWQYMDGTACYTCREKIPFWWSAFMADSSFRRNARQRWHDLRRGALCDSVLFATIDELSSSLYLEDRQQSNTAWKADSVLWKGNLFPVRGRAVPNGGFKDQIRYLHLWLSARCRWMDTHL